MLADRNEDLKQLFKDGNVLLQAVYARREAIHNLLVATVKLSHAAHRAGRRTPGPTSSRRSTTWTTWSTCSTHGRTSSTTACG